MKILVLGGAGDMGSRAVEDLAAQSDVERLTIADRNLTGAGRLADRLRTARAPVDVRPVDATDERDLVAAMTGYDVVASALGPFHRFELAMARAAVEAGVHYVSICDEWQAAEAVLDGLAERARDSRSIVLTGVGASPGLTNVAVRLAANDLDQLDRVEIACFQPLDAGGGEAVLQHMLFIMSGNVAIWRGGRRREVPALSESRIVELPRFGPLKLWNMGHSEPVTIPRSFPGVREVTFFMGFGPGSGWLVEPAKRGLFSTRRRVDLAAGALAAIERWTRKDEPGLGALRIDVVGSKDGQPAIRRFCGVGQMRDATGLALAVGALMVGRGQLTTHSPGVYAPEAVLEPRAFIGAMRERGIAAYRDLAMREAIE